MSPEQSSGDTSLHQDKERPDTKLTSSPTKLPDQKPFRGFDITSLIRKDDDKNGSCKPDRKSPVLSPTCSQTVEAYSLLISWPTKGQAWKELCT